MTRPVTVTVASGRAGKSRQQQETVRKTLATATVARGRLDGAAVSELNALARALAHSGETGALVRVWDRMGGAKAAEPATWTALDRLHARGKGRIPAGSLRLPPSGVRALAPARRLHKICKGRRLSARSDEAKQHLDQALAWFAAEQAKGRRFDLQSGKARGALANELCKELGPAGLSREGARGLVTKLKLRLRKS